MSTVDYAGGFRLYNTRSGRVEQFVPLNPPNVGIYSCGPTVYDYTHIGHLRTYVNSDVLVRLLRALGYQVKHVMNITDVGHLTSDADEGEDKLEKGARREGKTVEEIARFYERHFWKTMRLGNVQRPDIVARATEHIKEQIELIKRLEEKGYTYRTSVGVIFDTAKFPRYADFANLNLEEQWHGARVQVDPEKRQPWDFALWITNQPNHIMQWDSPWGRGFPGWHIECSAMSMKYLGEAFDIHTGGVDHIPIHHTNEIAQSEAATGKTFARFWFHSEFLMIDNQKMSKSLGNLYSIEDVQKRGYHPLSLRYLFLGSRYRKVMNFTWESLEAAQKALVSLWEACRDLEVPTAADGITLQDCEPSFVEALLDDLNSPRALASIWNLLRSDAPKEKKAKALAAADLILGLDLDKAAGHLDEAGETGERQVSLDEVDDEIRQLVQKREELRRAKQYAEADRIRDELAERGITIVDTPEGPELRISLENAAG